jgi:mediator of RNA polymerase II transcription subunit 20
LHGKTTHHHRKFIEVTDFTSIEIFIEKLFYRHANVFTLNLKGERASLAFLPLGLIRHSKPTKQPHIPTNMGVTMVLTYPIPDGKPPQLVLESLYKLVDILNAKRCGTFKVDCETFTSAPHVQPAKILQTFHDTERPLTTFALIEGGQNHLVADSTNFDIIVQTYLNQLYTCRKALKIECTGQKFELCEADFVIRIGQVSQDNSNTLRGITIEIEYTPCLVPSNCWDILAQVAQNFLPPSQIPPVLACDICRPVDTMKQYQQTFNAMRKQA